MADKKIINFPEPVRCVPGNDTRDEKTKAAMEYSKTIFTDYTGNPEVAQANMRMMAFSTGWDEGIKYHKRQSWLSAFKNLLHEKKDFQDIK